MRLPYRVWVALGVGVAAILMASCVVLLLNPYSSRMIEGLRVSIAGPKPIAAPEPTASQANGVFFGQSLTPHPTETIVFELVPFPASATATPYVSAASDKPAVRQPTRTAELKPPTSALATPPPVKATSAPARPRNPARTPAPAIAPVVPKPKPPAAKPTSAPAPKPPAPKPPKPTAAPKPPTAKPTAAPKPPKAKPTAAPKPPKPKPTAPLKPPKPPKPKPKP
jgi:hypothetical protein